jgi:hypothetical protein
MGFQSKRLIAAIVALVSAHAVSAQAVIRGYLYDDSTGARLRGGAIVLVDPVTDAPVANARTDSLGTFVVSVGAGKYHISAIVERYQTVMSRPVPLSNGEQLTIRIPIAREGDPRNPIGVLEHTRTQSGDLPEARSAGLDAGRVAERKRLGNGLIFDRSQLDRTNAQTLGDLLRALPGIAVSSTPTQQGVAMRRTMGSTTTQSGRVDNCRVGWFMDGRRIDRPGIVDPIAEGMLSIPVVDLEAVEVFRGLSEMPAEFAQPDLRCGAVSLWTRRG